MGRNVLLDHYSPIFLSSLLFALATLFPILNPPAVAPIFLSLTEGASLATRAALAKRIALNALMMLVIAMTLGHIVLAFFGISLAIVRVGGGMLVIASAWRLVNSPDGGTGHAAQLAEPFTSEMARARAFYPLTFPISCGPGTIAAAITVGASLRDDQTATSMVRLAGSLPALLLVSFSLFLCLRFAARFLHKLGESGTAVFMRLSAFILLCLGVQIVWDGISELLLQWLVRAGVAPAGAPSPLSFLLGKVIAS